MAAKIVRQPKKIALLGVPTSAAANAPGREGAPQALRSAGIVARLQALGYEVNDLGDDPAQVYQPDEQSPRARNLARVVAMLEALKPRVEIAVKSGALPLILSGDSSVALATVAGARRYFRHVGMVLIDRDAGLHTPATTTTGSVDGMVVSHLAGRGAAEMIRFWPEPPLVREPDLAVFGVERTDAGEDEAQRRSSARQYLAADIKRKGTAAIAQSAADRLNATGHEFILHIDADAIADFQATERPGTGGLTFDDVRAAAEIFATQTHLAAVEVTGYDPTKDLDGSGGKLLIELIAGILEKRLAAVAEAAESAGATAAQTAVATPQKAVTEPIAAKEPEPEEEVNSPVVMPGEAWSLPDDGSDLPGAADAEGSQAEASETSESSENTDPSHS